MASRKGTGHYEKIGRMGGLISAQVQVRRSFNEIYFSLLCKKVFKNVLTNEPIFEGWDSDVIIQDLKIAIAWSGAWHYKKIRDGHNLEQVQARDKIKDSIIKKHGYYNYIIKDMGGKNQKFVIEQFNKFIEFVNKEYNCNITLDDYEVDMTEYVKEKVVKEKVVKEKVIKEKVVKEKVNKEKVIKEKVIKEKVIKEKVVKEKVIKEKVKNHCMDCNKEIGTAAKRCQKCDQIKQRKCERPSLETLLNEVKELGYVGTGKKYSVTDNSIRKWIKNYMKEEEE